MLGWLAIPVTVLWIVGITNSVNLIDGLDGLAVGVSTIASTTMFVVALLVSEGNVALLLAALMGACLGFMPYNLNPAKIFMGDTGALLLGYVLSTVSVVGMFKTYALVTFVVPILALFLPLFDTVCAFFRRLLRGQSPMHPDRGHLHHRLIDMGLSQKQAVAILYSVSAVLGLCAVVLATDRHALRTWHGGGGRAGRRGRWAWYIEAHAARATSTTRPWTPSSPAWRSTCTGGIPSTRRNTRAAMADIRVLCVFGTRPEAIKMAPLALELSRRRGTQRAPGVRDGAAPRDARRRAGRLRRRAGRTTWTS